VNFDASHYFVLGLDHRIALEQLREYVVYLHLKDYVLKRAPLGNLRQSPDNAEPTALGDGDFPLTEHLAHLRSIGYDGVVSADLYVPDPDAALKQTAQNVIPMLRAL